MPGPEHWNCASDPWDFTGNFTSVCVPFLFFFLKKIERGNGLPFDCVALSGVPSYVAFPGSLVHDSGWGWLKTPILLECSLFLLLLSHQIFPTFSTSENFSCSAHYFSGFLWLFWSLFSPVCYLMRPLSLPNFLGVFGCLFSVLDFRVYASVFDDFWNISFLLVFASD